MPATFGRLLLLVALATLATPASAQLPPPPLPPPPPSPPVVSPVMSKLDPLVQGRVARIDGRSRVIVAAIDAPSVDSVALVVQQAGGILGRRLPILDAVVADVPNTSLAALSNSAIIRRIALDRTVRGTMNRTLATVHAATIRAELGYDGSGIGVAVIDSGVAPRHDDLTWADGTGQRVSRFVDFVRGEWMLSDDYGHGTHVAGIIAGNGFDSGGARSGVAPGAQLVVLKVLDEMGRGRISDVIAAIAYAVQYRETFGIRVINLSVGAGIFESAATDMLTLAAKRAVDVGIVVVASAGNKGRSSSGRAQYGGITAPGNAPWVLTVGASSHMGTTDRHDDTIAAFSSRGPTAIDRHAKPDIVAPGVGIESLSAPGSTLYASKPQLRLNGTTGTAQPPYFSLSGTSQAAPVVAGIVALMLQANPSLTPNAVKAILQFTAEMNPQYDVLTQGAGFVDARGAVELARYIGAPTVYPNPATAEWSTQIVWGNRRLWPGELVAGAAAWRADVIWGTVTSPTGETITWGGACQDVICASVSSADPQIVSLDGSALVLTTPSATTTVQSINVVWGSWCGGEDCLGATWSPQTVGTTSEEGDTVVWGSMDDGDTVVWGSSDDGDTVVWGSSDDGDTVVWGSSSDYDVVWEPNPEPSEEPDAKPVL